MKPNESKTAGIPVGIFADNDVCTCLPKQVPNGLAFRFDQLEQIVRTAVKFGCEQVDLGVCYGLADQYDQIEAIIDDYLKSDEYKKLIGSN